MKACFLITPSPSGSQALMMVFRSSGFRDSLHSSYNSWRSSRVMWPTLSGILTLVVLIDLVVHSLNVFHRVFFARFHSHHLHEFSELDDTALILVKVGHNLVHKVLLDVILP